MKSVRLGLVAIVALSLNVTAVCDAADQAVQPPVAASPHAKVQVVVIGVPSWKVSDYQYSALGKSIKDTCSELTDFFTKQFGENVEFHPSIDEMCTEDATTYDSIRRMLYHELPIFSKDTLTFVFMMSHGDVVKYDNGYLPQDVAFLTSDATDDDRDSRSLGVGVELISWMSRLKSGSTVLTFIDTCNAGAVETLSLKVQSDIRDALGLKGGLMVSSLNNHGTYAAAFTRSLLGVWNSQKCPAGKMEDAIYSGIEGIVGKLDGFDGYPAIPIPFAGSLCLSQVSQDLRLLFLYQGAKKNVQWTITNASTKAVVDDIKSHDTAYFFKLVPPGDYTVSARIEGVSKPADFGPYDLRTHATAPVFLDTATNGRAALTVVNTWLDRAQLRGLPTIDIHQLLRGLDATLAVFDSAGSQLKSEHDRDVDRRKQQAIDALNRDLRAAAGDPDKLRAVATTHIAATDYAGAAKALSKSAEATPDPSLSSETAKAAALFAGIAGDGKTAASIIRQFNLRIPQIFEAAGTAAQRPSEPSAIERLRTAAAIEMFLTDPFIRTPNRILYAIQR
jgi:hypothetical protein